MSLFAVCAGDELIGSFEGATEDEARRNCLQAIKDSGVKLFSGETATLAAGDLVVRQI